MIILGPEPKLYPKEILFIWVSLTMKAVCLLAVLILATQASIYQKYYD